MGGERERERDTHRHRHTRNVLQISNFYTQNEYTLKCASKKAVAINTCDRYLLEYPTSMDRETNQDKNDII